MSKEKREYNVAEETLKPQLEFQDITPENF
jgi:hypothetical protein